MKKTTKILAIAVCLALTVGTAFAQFLPETMIKMRRAGHAFSSWNMAKIRGMVDYSPASFEKEQVAAAADVIASIANSGMDMLFGPGTDKDVGSQKTSVTPEFFKEKDKVKELDLVYIKEANSLQKVAHAGDIKAISVQLRKVADSCYACHVRYKKD
jgi:cytochrome c556